MADIIRFLDRRGIPPRGERDSDSALPAPHAPRGKKTVRRTRRKVASATPVLPTAYDDGDAAPVDMDVVYIATLSDLVSQFPHLALEAGAPAAEAPEPPVVTPWLDAEFTRMVRELPEVHLLSHEASSDRALDWLRARQVNLPIFTVEDENFLLQEAGDFVLPGGQFVRFPPCKKDRLCAARVYRIPGAPPDPPPLTQVMFAHEKAALLAEGTPPLQRRLCILCSRLHTYELVLALRFNADAVRLSSDLLVQIYRNLCGKEQGYDATLCLLPQASVWEGFLDPIAIFKPTLLRWEFDEATRRWRINQDLMVFRPAADAAAAAQPRPFDTPQDFRLRSETLMRGASTHRPLNRVQRLVEALAPPSLRANLLRMMPPSDWTAAVVRRGGYEAAVVVDAFLLGRRERLNVDDVVCEDSVAVTAFHEALLHSSLWVARANAQGAGHRGTHGADWVAALSHLISKSAPYRCMTRKFPVVCLELLAAHPPLDNCLRQWTLCSLLGNYRAAHARGDIRPLDLDVRRRLYGLLTEGAGWARFKEKLACVLVFVVREIVVAEISGCPSMLLDLSTRLNWVAFAAAVGCTMASLRSVVGHSLQHTGDWPDAAALLSIVERGHHDVLAVAQRRPLQSLVRTVSGQALRACMDALPDLGADVVNVVHQWTRALPPGPAELGVQFVPWLRAFGVGAAAHRALWQLCLDYDREVSSKRELHERIVELARRFPRAVALLYVWCRAFREAQRCVRWALPQHYLQNQVAAIRTRLQLPAHIPLPDYAVSAKVCRGCARLFDGVWLWREASAKKPLRAVRKILRGARADLLTDAMVCDECTFKQNHTTTVDAVVLLGCALVCERGIVLLCPQPGCGMPMVLDRRCIFTAFGVACASCTLAATERPPFATQWDPMCCLCHKKAREPRLFPHQLTVCGYHVPEDVVDAWATVATRDEGLAVLRAYAERRREQVWELGRHARTRSRNAERSRNRMTGRQRFFSTRG